MNAVEDRTARAAGRILVVDDHAVNCELLDAMLAPSGYQVEQAYSGGDALQAASEHQPDLVLLDVNMPGMDGFEVARRLRADAATRLIPIVMVTALGDLEHRVRGLESGADDYLAKPVNRHELLARVRTTLNLSYYRRQLDERQKLDLVLDDVSDGILIVGADGRVRDASPSARRLLVLGQNAAGRAIGELWGELGGAPDDLAGAVARGQALDFTLERRDPPLFVAASMRSVRGPDGAATGAVMSLRDVTRQTLEHKLQHDVLSFVSHKFRTPLTVVTLWTKMLADADCGPLTDQQREALAAMSTATEQLAGLLEGMLSYIEWTKRLRRLDRRPLPFRELEEMLRQRAQEIVGAPHRLVIERETDGEIVVDSEIFVEALVELVRNSVKFGGDKPVEVRVQLRRDGGHNVVSVADDGPGIPPEQLERVFERFYQVETDFTGQVLGAGLGLALVKAGVEALGASIHVESRLQRGTRFDIIL